VEARSCLLKIRLAPFGLLLVLAMLLFPTDSMLTLSSLKPSDNRRAPFVWLRFLAELGFLCCFAFALARDRSPKDAFRSRRREVPSAQISG